MRMFRMVLGITLLATAIASAAPDRDRHSAAPRPEAWLRLWQTELQFDTVLAGTTTCRTLSLRNIGDEPLIILEMRIGDDSGAAASAYSIRSGVTGSIAPGDSDFIVICFQPPGPGSYDVVFTIRSNGTFGLKRIPLKGYVRYPSYQHVSVADTALDFGATVWSTETLRELSIRNSGGPFPLTVRSQSVTGGAFSLKRAASGSIASGDTSAAVIAYTPTRLGADSGTFTIVTDDPSRREVAVPLRGRCVPFPGPRIYFPNDVLYILAPKNCPAVDSICVWNIGSADLILYEQSVADTAYFSLVRPARSPIGPWDSAWIAVRWFKTTPYGYSGGDYGELRIRSNDTVTPYVGIPIDVSVWTGAGPLPGAPDGFTLRPNYPNPFPASGSAGTTLEYDLAEAATVRLSVYSCTGRRVAVLDEAWREAGRYRCRWTPERLPPGLYTAVLTVATRSGARSVSRLRMICTN